MVYESRVGEVIAGASSWRIEEIGHDQVTVSPAPGVPGKLPFWHGDAVGRPIELGRALGAFVGELEGTSPAATPAVAPPPHGSARRTTSTSGRPTTS